VTGVSYVVPRGSIFGFLGPNGAGKNTILGVMLGLITGATIAGWLVLLTIISVIAFKRMDTLAAGP
jgi:ABC-type multidrug transport system ATPase subunit